MTGKPQQGLYLITEQQIKSFERLLHKKLPVFRERPYQSEREKVLDELWAWTEGDDNELDRHATHKGDYVHPSGRLRKKIAELRAGEP